MLGRNGQGKTNLAEALAYLATLSSFRGAPPDALIRAGADHGIIRATVRDDDEREVLIEAELSRVGPQPGAGQPAALGQRTRDLLGVVRVSVFAPDDLVMVKGGPAERRRFLDDTLVALATKYDAMRLEIDRVVRQRNVLLKQAGGRLDDEIETTLDVWDARLAAVGDQFGHARATLVAALSADGGRGVRAARRGRRSRSSWCTSPSGGATVWPRRSRRLGATTCAGACRRSDRTATTWRSG